MLGPTASGKSSLAEELADKFNATIINGDAFQMYRGMDIGTAKPTDTTRYELLNLKNPDEEFGVGEYVLLAAARLQEHFNNNVNVILCGGTGLYIRALIEEYQDLSPAPSPELRRELNERPEDELVLQLQTQFPEMAATTDLKNRIRVTRALERCLAPKKKIRFSIPPFSKKKVAIVPEVTNTELNIQQRTSLMLQNGWVNEVKELLNLGYRPGNPGFRAIGYTAIVDFLYGDITEEEMVETIEAETRNYAKRQRTWLRSEPDLEVFSNRIDALGATQAWIQSMH
ncbi:MAG: tRNA (adenosine(37)-N6)-dimethylallyltransferase MiaA [Fimbriimonas sp.]|nr:tRNA (adenosine(37)-N6)-dimethylallyltransferase MiaA [Fimbriimonas sp.]